MKMKDVIGRVNWHTLEKIYGKLENDFDEALGNDDIELMDKTLAKFRKAAKQTGVQSDKVEQWITDQLHPEAMPGYSEE